MSTFSYAQAAKGQLSTTPSAPQSVTSQEASTTSNQNADAPAGAGTSTATHSVAASSTSSDPDVKESSTQPAVPTESVTKTETAESDSPASPAVPTSDSAQKTSVAENELAASSEKKSATETPNERRVKGQSSRSDISDNRKSRKGKKSKPADKDSEQEQTAEKEKEPEAPKVQLSEAPIPAVNFWVQRAKEAKTKTVQPSPAHTQPGNTTESKPKPVANNTEDPIRSPANAAKGQKKEFVKDVNEQASKRHAPRGSRGNEKGTSESLPSVADAASWPTPETAAIETKETTAKSTEADDVQEDKNDSGPKDKPKWVAIPFVPSAVFETPLPSRNPRGSKTGATRGGRETGARGHAGASNGGDRTQAPGSARPAGERFAEGATNGARAPAATVAPAKRSSVDATRDVRKVSGSNKDGSVGSSTAQVNGTDEATKTTQAEAKDGAASQQQATTDSPSTEKRSDARPDPSRESFTPAAKENNGHHHPTKAEKRSGRGRGGHPGANGRAHGFAANGQAYGNHMGSRQNSYPGNMSMGYGMPGGGAAANGHPSRNSTSNAFYRSNGRNGRGSNVQNAQGWNLDPSVQSMPAMPPQQYYYEQQNVLTMLTRQLSYYFSVNNLLKDSFLRRCMDSQGYVFLDVILSFQRIQQLSTDLNIVRLACVDCPDIELVTGMEDHRDRIRRVAGWTEFVYPPGARNEEVNFDDGPANVWRQDRNTLYMYPYGMGPQYPVESPGFYPPNGAPYQSYGVDGFQQFNMMHGVNGHAAHKDVQLSAEVPEFSPNGGSSASDADQLAALKATATASEKDHQANGTTPATANGTNDVTSHPYTNGVAVDAEGASH